MKLPRFKIFYIRCSKNVKHLRLNIQNIQNILHWMFKAGQASDSECSKHLKFLYTMFKAGEASKVQNILYQMSKVCQTSLNIQNIQNILHWMFKAGQASDSECSKHLKFLYRMFKAGETSEVKNILYQMFNVCQTSKIESSKHSIYPAPALDV